jgi:hypothetical protein
MVGRRMLALIDMRLRQAFPEKQNQLFGGRSVILVGDFGQLPPMLDEPMYSKFLENQKLTDESDFHSNYSKSDHESESSSEKEWQQDDELQSHLQRSPEAIRCPMTASKHIGSI